MAKTEQKLNKLTIKDRVIGSLFWFKRQIVLFLRRFKSKRVLAVYDDDLDGILEKMNLKTQIDNGEIRCKGCGRKISKENLGIIRNENGAIHMYCFSTSCTKEIS